MAQLSKVLQLLQNKTRRPLAELSTNEQIAVNNALHKQNSVDEFITYTLTSPDFQSALKKIRIDGADGTTETVFSRLANLLKQLLGINADQSAFEMAMQATAQFVETVTDTAADTDVEISLSYQGARSGKETRGQQEVNSARQMAQAIIKAEGDAQQRFVDNSKGHWRRLKGIALGGFSGRQLADMYESLFKKFTDAGILRHNPITQISDLMQNMQALRNNQVNKAEKIDQRWARLARTSKAQYQTLGRVMYESTIAAIDPRLPYTPLYDAPKTDKTQREQLQHRQNYDRIMAYWATLDPQTQTLYSDVEQFYRNQYEQMIQALKERADGLFGPRGVEVQKLIDQQMGKVMGPYFPLMRFGRYFIRATDPDGKDYREHFEKEGEMLAAKQELIAAGFTITSNGQMKAYQDMRTNSAESGGIMPFIKTVEQRILAEDSPYTQRVKMQFLDELNQTALSLLPDTSYAKRSMHRRNISGYDSNARRAFNATALTGANRLARVSYGWQVEETISAMREATDNNAQTNTLSDQDNITAQNVIDELGKRHDLNMAPNTNPLASAAVNLAFLNSLGASLGAGLVNLTQTPMLAIPILGSRYGYRRTSRYMAKAATDYFTKGARKPKDWTDALTNAWFTLEDNPALSADEQTMLKQLIDDGTIETTQASTMAGNAGVDLDQASAFNRDWYNNLVRGSGVFFHNAEIANRQITALTGYRLWRDAHRKKHGDRLTADDIQKGATFARKVTFDAHFDYSNYNRPRYMKGNWARVFLIFKQYAQNMTYLLGKTANDALRGESAEVKRIATRQLFGMLGLSTLASGVMGLPGLFFLKWLAEVFVGDEDEPFDVEAEFRLYASELFNEQIAHALAKGVFNGFANIDLHARVKMSDLWFSSDDRELSARDEATNMLMTASGPFFSQMINTWVGVREIAEGEAWRGMERVLPKFIRDGMRSVRYSQEGLQDAYGNVLIEDFTLYETLNRTIGLGSGRESEAWSARNTVKRLEQKLGARRQKLLNENYQAQTEQDRQQLRTVQQAIQGFNAALRRNELTGLRITNKTLRQSAEARERRKQQTKGGIYLPATKIGLRDYAAGFASQ